jgi:hypothetical protein
METMPNGRNYLRKTAILEAIFPGMLSNLAEFHAIAEEFLDAGQL